MKSDLTNVYELAYMETIQSGGSKAKAHWDALEAVVKSERARVERLERIAALCWVEMNHGLDLPSDVWDAVEKYYAEEKSMKFGQCACKDCVEISEALAGGKS